VAAFAAIVAIGAAALPPAWAAEPTPSFSPKIEGVDFGGVWMLDNYVGSGAPIQRRILHTAEGGPVPMQPWVAQLYQQRIDDEAKGHTFAGGPTFCLPHGMPQMITAAAYPIQIFQSPGQIAFVHELGRQYRIIHMDRGHLPADDLYPDYYGDSVGRWEGDTLVIDTIGLSKKTALDMLGMPHTDAMHVIEHIRRPTHDKLDIRVTIEDKGAFTRPWDMHVTYSLQPKSIEILEYICLDGNRNQVVDGKVSIDGKLGPSASK